MSLRARVLSGMLLIALVLGVASVVVLRSTHHNLLAQVDAQLEAAGLPRRLAGGALPAGTGAPPPGAALNRPSAETGDVPERVSPLFVGVVRDGQLQTIFRPNFAEDEAVPVLDPEDLAARAADGEPFTVGSDTDGVDYRVTAFEAPTGETMVVGLSLENVDRSVHRLLLVEIAVTSTVLLLLGAVAWWVIRLGVRPLKRLTAAAAAIGAGDLTARVPEVHSTRTEAGELGAGLNQMLSRIEDAFAERAASEDRLRRFLADASHELRTPVSTIRGYAELYRGGALDHPEEMREAMRRTEDEALRMGGLIDDMLLLARLDQGRPLEREPVDLSILAVDTARDARAVAPERPIDVCIDGPVVVIGDDHRLRQVVTNLVRNALVHTPARTPVEIRTAHTGTTAVLEVADRGPGMAPESAARAFERFYRADPSRCRQSGGSGLGLSIVQATVTALGGHVGLESHVDQGTTVRVELPLAQPEPSG